MSDGTYWVQTLVKKRRVNPMKLDGDEQFDIEDIAHATSMICRFTGHVPFHYSVAQHSLYVLVATAVLSTQPELQLAALLHDAEEVYLNDLAQPIKHQLSNYRRACRRVRRAIYEQHGLRPSLVDNSLVKAVDAQVLRVEAEHFFGEECVDDWNLAEYDYEIDSLIPPIRRWSQARAEKLFLHEYERLHGLLPQSINSSKTRASVTSSA